MLILTDRTNLGFLFDFNYDREKETIDFALLAVDKNGDLLKNLSFLYEKKVLDESIASVVEKIFLQAFYDNFVEREKSFPFFAFRKGLEMFFPFCYKKEVFSYLSPFFRKRISLIMEATFDKITIVDDKYFGGITINFPVRDRVHIFYNLFTGKPLDGIGTEK